MRIFEFAPSQELEIDMSTGVRLTSLLGILGLFVVGYVYTMVANRSPSAAPTQPKEEGGWFDGLFDEATKGKVASNAEPSPKSDILKLRNSLRDLQVPCGYIISLSQYTMDPRSLNDAPVNPIDTLLDPNLDFSSITESAVMSDRYLKILYEEGGKSKTIPAGSLFLRMGSMEATVPSPELRVVKDDVQSSTSYTIRLGKDFMKATQAKVDLEEREMHVLVHGERVMIPFLQRRSSPASGDEL